MEFYFKSKGAKTHLYRCGGLFSEDLGELTESFTGKLKTNNVLGENFELDDISSGFSKGDKYSIKSSKGLNGIIEKNIFGNTYVLK